MPDDRNPQINPDDPGTLPIIDRLRLLQTFLGVTSDDVLAERLGVTRKTLYAWFDGKREPSARVMKVIEMAEAMYRPMRDRVPGTRGPGANLPGDHVRRQDLLREAAMPRSRRHKFFERVRGFALGSLGRQVPDRWRSQGRAMAPTWIPSCSTVDQREDHQASLKRRSRTCR